MILFFRTPSKSVIATEIDHKPSQDEINELCWLYGDATLEDAQQLQGFFVGPRREMITPWSTNAVEITQNMSLNGISRIEEYFPVESEDAEHDPMLQRMYNGIDQNVFTVNHEPEPIKYVDDLEKYNEEEGLALSEDEMAYLHKLEKENGRPLTDSEIFGFAQINSEHCRHKIFGGSCHRAVCSCRPNYKRFLPGEGYRERDFAEGRDSQLPYYCRAFQWCCYRYWW